MSIINFVKLWLKNTFSQEGAKKNHSRDTKTKSMKDACFHKKQLYSSKSPTSTKKETNTKENKKQVQPDKWSIQQFQLPPVVEKKRFHDFNLPEQLMHGIYDLNFKYCTPVQAQVLERALSGGDTLAKAQTGTGKTAAFLITAIKQLLEIPPPSSRYLGEPRVVIVAPTRELVLQIGQDASALCKYLSINIALLVGGVNQYKQQKKLEKNYVDILIATPGRLLDFMQQQLVHLDLTEILILDEADRMLDMGFIPQIRKIVMATPKPGDRQTLLFSATVNNDVLDLTQKWTWNAMTIEIASEEKMNTQIEQKFYLVAGEEKYKLLLNILRKPPQKKCIIFSNWRTKTKNLSDYLSKKGLKVDYLSGDVPQKKRIHVLENFKEGKIDILVATDVAGRGIHVNDVSHVINFNLPENPDDYVHRIGRTGRAGKQGVSISFVCENDAFLMDELEAFFQTKFSLTHPDKSLLI